MSGITDADGNQTSAYDQTVSAKSILKNFLIYLFKPTAFGVVMLVYVSLTSGNFNLYYSESGCRVVIYWSKAATELPVLYLLLNIICRLISHIGRPIRIFRLFMIMLLSVIVSTFLASIIMSKYYLGYYFFRPEVFNELRDVNKVHSIIPFQTENKGGIFSIYYNLDYSMDNEFERYARWSSYTCDTRNLILFKSMGLPLPNVSQLPPNSPDYYALVRDAGIFGPSDYGKKKTHLMRGLIIDAADSAGRELVLIAGQDGVASSHYPYYELLFVKQPSSGKLTLLRSQHFYGGEEDNEWYYVWLVLSWMGINLAFLLTVLIAVGRGIMSWIASKHRQPARAS